MVDHRNAPDVSWGTVEAPGDFGADADDGATSQGSELSIRDVRALLKQLFTLAPAGVVVGSLRGGHILDANPAFCRMVGYSRKELIGRTTLELELWDDPGKRESLLHRLKEEKTLRQEEIVLRARNGSRVVFIGSYQLIRLHGEECLLGVLNDMTKRKEMEERMVEAKRHVEEMARIRTSILNNMTHEVRTPLTVILGFTSVLREGARKEYHRFIELIERSARRLLLLLDTIMDLAELEAGSMKPNIKLVNVDDVVRKAVEESRPSIEAKKLEIDLQLPQTTTRFPLDHEIFAHVLGNLLNNAVKFTDTGRIVVQVEQRDDRLVVHVIDTGLGIDADYLPKIFDEFSQASTGLERTHQGAGLGLVVSRRLTELLGGTLSVRSAPGEGSKFTVSLPHPEN